MQEIKEKGFLGQGLGFCTARAHFGSPCLRGKILIISCHFVFKKQSFRLCFYTGIVHPTRGLNKICDTGIPLCQCQETTLNIIARIYSYWEQPVYMATCCTCEALLQISSMVPSWEDSNRNAIYNLHAKSSFWRSCFSTSLCLSQLLVDSHISWDAMPQRAK